MLLLICTTSLNGSLTHQVNFILGESSAAGLKGKDTDIVPFETMRAELLKKSSILSGMYSDVSAAAFDNFVTLSIVYF